MRIAGSTVRRNYLSRYEKNFGDKYDSEKKIESNHKFQRGSESPIDAAQALRIRKSISQMETYKANLKSADTIYTNAESSLTTISEIIQKTYEKLIEGAHGTRNDDDLNIIAMEIDNYAEEMVQAMNIDIADRKVFGGLNNTTVCYAIEGNSTDRYVTYNGVALNSSSDPYSFPYSQESFLDIGIGMTTDQKTDRINDQTAFPITFNGAKCLGCGVSGSTCSIDLNTFMNKEYTFNVHAGGQTKKVNFIGDVNPDVTIENFNEALREAFKTTPEIQEDGSIRYLENAIPDYSGTPEIKNYAKTSLVNSENGSATLNLQTLSPENYYRIHVTYDGITKTIDFPGGADVGESKANIDSALKKAFGTIGTNNAVYMGTDGKLRDAGYKEIGTLMTDGFASSYYDDELAEVDIDENGNIDLDSLYEGERYNINVNGTPVTFVAGADSEENIAIINKAFGSVGSFGTGIVPYITQTGTMTYEGEDSSIVVHDTDKGSQLDITNTNGYAKNIIQLVLDSAKALRDGDQQLVARYADLIYAAQSNLSVSIADLGTHSKFIEFNQNRIDDTLLNLYTRQNDLEITDLAEEITNYKVLDSVYNATLQMGANILSQTIFDYIH